MTAKAPSTWFIDIDGSLIVNHNAGMSAQLRARPVELLSGAIELLNALHDGGHRIVLTTARPESNRANLERALSDEGLFWDVLLMGLPKGPRVVVNDTKGTPTALAINHPRNQPIDPTSWLEVLERASVHPDRESVHTG